MADPIREYARLRLARAREELETAFYQLADRNILDHSPEVLGLEEVKEQVKQ